METTTTFADMFGGTVLGAVGNLLFSLVSWITTYLLSPLAAGLFELGTGWVTIPGLGTITLAFQAIAIVAVIAIRIGIGVKEGILGEGWEKKASVGEFALKTVGAIVLVAAAPALCSLAMDLANKIYCDGMAITGWQDGKANPVKDAISWFNFDEANGNGFRDLINGANEDSSMLIAIVGMTLLELVIMVCTMTIGWDFLTRHLEMLVLATIGPLVAINSATEGEKGAIKKLLSRVFGLGVTNLLQQLLLLCGLKAAQTWFATEVLQLADGKGAVPYSVALLIGVLVLLGAAVSLPDFIARYTTTSTAGNGTRSAMTTGVGILMGLLMGGRRHRGDSTGARRNESWDGSYSKDNSAFRAHWESLSEEEQDSLAMRHGLANLFREAAGWEVQHTAREKLLDEYNMNRDNSKGVFEAKLDSLDREGRFKWLEGLDKMSEEELHKLFKYNPWQRDAMLKVRHEYETLVTREAKFVREWDGKTHEEKMDWYLKARAGDVLHNDRYSDSERRAYALMRQHRERWLAAELPRMSNAQKYEAWKELNDLRRHYARTATEQLLYTGFASAAAKQFDKEWKKWDDNQRFKWYRSYCTTHRDRQGFKWEERRFAYYSKKEEAAAWKKVKSGTEERRKWCDSYQKKQWGADPRRAWSTNVYDWASKNI